MNIPTCDNLVSEVRSQKQYTDHYLDQTKHLTESSFLNVPASSVTNIKIKTVNYWHSVDWYPYLEVLEANTNLIILKCLSSEKN